MALEKRKIKIPRKLKKMLPSENLYNVFPDFNNLLGEDEIAMKYDERLGAIISYGKSLVNLMKILGFHRSSGEVNLDANSYSFELYENDSGESLIARYKLKMGGVLFKYLKNREIMVLLPIMHIDPIVYVSTEDLSIEEFDLRKILKFLEKRNAIKRVAFAYFSSTLLEILHELLGENPIYIR